MPLKKVRADVSGSPGGHVLVEFHQENKYWVQATSTRSSEKVGLMKFSQ
jgi:hypothetical protein